MRLMRRVGHVGMSPMGRLAGRIIGRAGRRFVKRSAAKRKARRNVGESVGTSTAKRTPTQSTGVQNQADRVLHYQELILPNEGTTPDQRTRNIINLRGFKLCQEFKTGTGTPSGLGYIYLNVACVSSKTDPTSNSVSTNHWFRGNNDDRAVDFDVVGSSIDLHCRPINTDRWNIFFHQRMKLGAGGNDVSKKTIPFMKWVTINRQIRFTDTNQPSTRFFVVWWYAVDGTDRVTTAANVVNTQWSHITYFREPLRG